MPISLSVLCPSLGFMKQVQPGRTPNDLIDGIFRTNPNTWGQRSNINCREAELIRRPRKVEGRPRWLWLGAKNMTKDE